MPGTAATGTVVVVAMGTKPPPLVELADCEPDFVEGHEEEEKEEKEEVEEEVGGQE